MLKLVKFECKKQITDYMFIIILALCTVFAVSQFREVVHLPVENEDDIKVLYEIGERDYIFVPATEHELKDSTAQYLKQHIFDGDISKENAEEFEPVIEMLKDENAAFDDICAGVQDNEKVYTWLMAGKNQFSKRAGNVEEVNENIREALGKKGYSPEFIRKYVTYMQAIAVFLIFPLFLMLIIRDYQCGMYEIVYAQPFSSTGYIISRFCGMFLPFSAYLYLLGQVFNSIIAFRFCRSNAGFSYTPFILSFCVYILPTIFFLSSLIMFLMLLIRKAVAVFPIYIFYVNFCTTPKAFVGPSGYFFVGMNPVMRLDGDIPSTGVIVFNRVLFLVLGVVFLKLSCVIYEKTRQDLKRVIAL